MKHEIKILPEFYCRVEDGSKTFEVRNNDRGYQPGDTVVLKEWDDSPIETTKNREVEFKEIFTGPPCRGFTGRELKFRVGYVLPIRRDVVVFSLLPCPTPRLI